VPRTFIALRPCDDALDHIESVVSRARRAMVGPRWTSREQWHVTLHFFGNLSDDETDKALDALAQLATCRPFMMRFNEAGAFPSPARARVMWLSSDEGRAACVGLASLLSVVLATAGFPLAEDRPFRPHLTVARLRVPSPAAAGVGALHDAFAELGEGPPWTVRDVVLYESHLRREGPVYSVLDRVALSG
jgi:2'-5' RNA ligase